MVLTRFTQIQQAIIIPLMALLHFTPINPHVVKVNNLFYNLSPQSVSPFDVMYVAPVNQEHGESNSEWQELFDNAVMPANLYLQNQDIRNNRYYHARNQIIAGSNVTSNLPQGDFAVKVNADVKMTAGNSISLLPGFRVEAGATFSAIIQPDTNCIITNSSIVSANYGNLTYDVMDITGNTEDPVFDIITSTEKALKIYPNPVNCCLIVSVNSYVETDITIEIYNFAGQLLHLDKKANRISEIDVRNYFSGMYVVKVVFNGQIYTEKFIKQ